jgi:hypothetical protein
VAAAEAAESAASAAAAAGCELVSADVLMRGAASAAISKIVVRVGAAL